MGYGSLDATEDSWGALPIERTRTMAVTKTSGGGHRRDGAAPRTDAPSGAVVVCLAHTCGPLGDRHNAGKDPRRGKLIMAEVSDTPR